MKVFGAEVARVTRSVAALGEEADLESARNGYWIDYVSRSSRLDSPMIAIYLQGIESFTLLHVERRRL